MDKKQTRVLALGKRDGMTEKQRRVGSGEIIRRLMRLSCYQEADAILTYVSFRSEADTFPLISSALAEKKAVFVPKVLGRDMEFFRIFSLDDLREGYRGILEPDITISYGDWISQNFGVLPTIGEAGDTPSGLPHTLVCVPGAAFDRKRRRIGYGGGFYDRYLSKMMESPSGMADAVALAFDCQIFEEIPCEVHDICPDCIVTEREIIL